MVSSESPTATDPTATSDAFQHDTLKMSAKFGEMAGIQAKLLIVQKQKSNWAQQEKKRLKARYVVLEQEVRAEAARIDQSMKAKWIQGVAKEVFEEILEEGVVGKLVKEGETADLAEMEEGPVGMGEQLSPSQEEQPWGSEQEMMSHLEREVEKACSMVEKLRVASEKEASAIGEQQLPKNLLPLLESLKNGADRANDRVKQLRVAVDAAEKGEEVQATVGEVDEFNGIVQQVNDLMEEFHREEEKQALEEQEKRARRLRYKVEKKQKAKETKANAEWIARMPHTQQVEYRNKIEVSKRDFLRKMGIDLDAIERDAASEVEQHGDSLNTDLKDSVSDRAAGDPQKHVEKDVATGIDEKKQSGPEGKPSEINAVDTKEEPSWDPPTGLDGDSDYEDDYESDDYDDEVQYGQGTGLGWL